MDKPGAASLKEDLPCKAPGDRRLLALLEAACREERNNVSLAFAAARPSVPMAVAEALDEFLLQAEELIMRRHVVVGGSLRGGRNGHLDAHKEQLHSALVQFKEEEEGWTRLMEEQRICLQNTRTDVQSQPQMNASTVAPESDSNQDNAAGVPEKGTLLSTVRDAVRAVSTQADALAQVVSQAEAAADTADARAKALAMQMSRNAFAPFVHVDSPNVLIRNLVKRADDSA
jgi:hypothetical protein